MNGLMLSPDADCLFDRGFVSFDEHSKVMVSPRLASTDARRLGLGWILGEAFAPTLEGFGFEEAPIGRPTRPFKPEQQSYLGYHRQAVFLG